ncbi:MAG: serine hydrolase domain-containing protein [Halioglobus sp.]
MNHDLEISGYCDERFTDVRRIFAESLVQSAEGGASFSACWQGNLVVNLWGGTRDRSQTLPWQQDTLVNVFSATKGITALCAHRLIEQGVLDLESPVGQYWPAFSSKGKRDISVRMILNHRSGLSAFREEIPAEAIYDWGAMVSALEREEPWWVPGTKQGYQAFTFGWLIGELIRRVSGKSVGQYFRDEIAEPLGLDFHIGLNSDQLGRVADVARLGSSSKSQKESESQPARPDLIADKARPDSIAIKAFMNPPTLATGTNSSAWRQSEIPSANGHGTAQSLASIYGGLANGGTINGVRLLREETIRNCYTESSSGIDAVLLVPMRFSLGFMLSNPQAKQMKLGQGGITFGHTGAGGSVGFADPKVGLGFGYVTNRLGGRAWVDPRAEALVAAVYKSV